MLCERHVSLLRFIPEEQRQDRSNSLGAEENEPRIDSSENKNKNKIELQLCLI